MEGAIEGELTAMKRVLQLAFGTCLCLHLVVHRRHSGESSEVFGEEGGVGKVHFLGYLRCRLVGVSQFNLDACDECAVEPVFGCGAAGLSDDGGEIALGEAQAVGVVTHVVVLGAMLPCELQEAVEYGLFA